jgi:membrane protein DedA with SNARE-associated domain
MQELISEYGYLAIFVGTFFEGETILVLGGVAAKLGLLEIEWVILSAFFGSTLGDQIWYYLGYNYGHWMLNRFKGWRGPMERAFALLNKYDTTFILSFRFIYGVRTVSSVVIGMAKVLPRRFIPLNVLAAGIWALAIAYLGYSLGHAFEMFVEEFHTYSEYVLGGLIGVCVLIWVWHTISRSRQSRGIVVEEHPGGLPEFHHVPASDEDGRDDDPPCAADHKPEEKPMETVGAQTSTGVSRRPPHSVHEPS